MRSTQAVLLFVTLLTALVDITTSASTRDPSGLDELIERLQNLPTDLLPYSLRVNVTQDLRKTSTDFKKLYVKHDSKLVRLDGIFSPISALNETIQETFKGYKKKATNSAKMLNDIQEVDPIGFNAYLNTKSSCRRDEYIEEFHAIMYDRLQLFQSRKDTSFIELLKTNGKLHKIPEKIREEVTSEGVILEDQTMDYFMDLVMEQMPQYRMYHDFNYQLPQYYQPHNSTKYDDVQILYGGQVAIGAIGHWICINYKISNRYLYVYDSFYNQHLNPQQEQIVVRLYPDVQRVVYVDPKTYQKDSTSCGAFAIYYATNLLLGKDPAKVRPKLNNVYGDQSLYMRLHILRMFANKQLALFE